jgi:hypothetical protein
MYLVGVEVKKPGGDVLLEPTVLGESSDQMLLVEGFHGMRPVIGILTAGDEWVVSWFLADQQVIPFPLSSFKAFLLTSILLPSHQKTTTKRLSPEVNSDDQQ